MKTDAVIWDYDGTLVDSTLKNIEITKQILNVVAPRLSGDSLPATLKSEEKYHYANHASRNWQDLYINYYGFTEKETSEAGKLWTEYQLNNKTPVDLFPNVTDAIKQITCSQGICSQNSAQNIIKVMKEHDILKNFKAIIGYDDLPDKAQKPLPDSGIICLKRIFKKLENKVIIYVGDHQGDVQFARNIASKLNKTNRIIAVAVNYSGAEIDSWSYQPDMIISDPFELLELIK